MRRKKEIPKEIIPLAPDDCFKVVNRRKATFDYPVHYHPEFELNYIRNAKGALRIVGDHASPIDDHELVLVGPNLYHAWEQGDCQNTDICEVTIQFPEDLFPESLLNRNVMANLRDMLNHSQHGIAICKSVSERAGPLIESLSAKEGFQSFVELVQILDMISNPQSHQKLSSGIDGSSGIIGNRKLRDIYSYIDRHISQKIKLNEIAKSMNMTSITFCRFIKGQTGKSFITFLNEQRVGYASRLLIETTDTISDIALACGFNNQSNFNRVFKHKKGCSPKEFRERSSGIKRVV